MSAQMQPRAGEPEPTDAITVIETDHRVVDGLFDRYERLGREGDIAERGRIVESVTRELRVHAAMEEQVLYPAIEEALGDEGRELVEESLREHAEAKVTLDEIEALEPSSDELHERMTALIEEVRHHVDEEEGQILPKLRGAMDSKALARLGEELRGARMSLLGVVEHGGAREEGTRLPDVPDMTPVAAEEGLVIGDAEQPRRGAARPRTRARTTKPKRAKPKTAKTRASKPKTAKTRASKPKTAKSRTSRVRLVYRVTITATGRWAVGRKGSARPSATFDTKPEAVARGRELAKRGARGQLVVHGKDGRIQNEFTYGEDTRRSRG